MQISATLSFRVITTLRFERNVIGITASIQWMKIDVDLEAAL